MLNPHSLINFGDISTIHWDKTFFFSHTMALYDIYLPYQFGKERTCRFSTAAVGVCFIHWIRNGFGAWSERFFTLAFITPRFYSLRAYKAWMVLDCLETGNRRMSTAIIVWVYNAKFMIYKMYSLICTVHSTTCYIGFWSLEKNSGYSSKPAVNPPIMASSSK